MVIHILKDGSTTTDISGTRITKEDFISVYRIAEGINRRNGNNNEMRKMRENDRTIAIEI